jgi:hypothetical protein
MRRHALSQPEVEQFRQAVYAACLDRHYPGLLSEGDLAQQPDVDEVAAALFEENWLTCYYAHPVSAVAAIAELEHALADERGPRANRAQIRRQQVALAYLWRGLDRHHGHHGRYAVQRATVKPLVGFVERHFGRCGPDERLSVLSLRLQESLSASCAERLTGRSGLAARRLLAVSEEALAQGDLFAGIEACYAVLLHPPAFSHGEYHALIERGEGLIPMVLGVGRETWWTPHACMVLASIRAGDLKRAGRHLEDLRTHADQGAAARQHMEQCGAMLAWHTGGRREAVEHLQRALALAQAEGDEDCVQGTKRRIEACIAGAAPPQPLAEV